MSKPKIKIGYWQERGGGLAIVNEHATADSSEPWHGIDSTGRVSAWRDDGSWLASGSQSKHDLVKFIVPLW